MKYNALFEYVIHTSGENTDDIDDFDDRDNFWAPIPENLLFEHVLKEAHLQEMGNFLKSTVAKSLNRLLVTAKVAFDAFAKSLRNKNNFSAIHNKENNHIEKAITDLINSGNTDEQPFRIKDDNKIIIDLSRNNFEAELTTWTDGMVELLPKDQGDFNKCHGFSITNIKTNFIQLYKKLLGAD
jgi:hypothetical protein